MNATFLCLRNPCFCTIKVIPQNFLQHSTDHFTEDSEINDAMDEETEHWPVPPWLQDKLNKIKFKYYAIPLAVYADDKFVEPALINNTIRGALVDFTIQKSAQDSFNASIEQIIVLCPGEAHPTTVYKRKNPCNRPILVKPSTFPPPKQIGEGSASGNNNESAANKENEGPPTKRCRAKVKESNNVNKPLMSEKHCGKQKAKESKDEVEVHVKKKSD